MLDKLNIPANILALLEDYPVKPPQFPDIERKEDTRIVAGGMSSSLILRENFDLLSNNVISLVYEVNRLKQKVESKFNFLSNLNSLSSIVNTCIYGISGSVVSGLSTILNFFDTENSILGLSECSIEPLYGQATLPYLVAPQSQIVRLNKEGARPGTVARYALINRAVTSIQDLENSIFNSSDNEIYLGLDGRLDTSWAVPINKNTEDLILNIKLSESLGDSSRINALCLIPWPIYGTSIIEIWARDNSNSGNNGWVKLDNKGQLGYNTSNTFIQNAGSHRYLFPPKLAKEFLVRLRPQNESNIGLTNFDAQYIEFKSSGKIVIDASVLSIPSIKKATIAGLDIAKLNTLTTNVLGSQLTINLNTNSTWESPVINSVALEGYALEEEGTGFDIDVWAP